MPLGQKPQRFKDDWIKFGGLGAEVMASVLLGALGGYGLDRLLNTRPWFLIVGFILGAAAGFRTLFRLLDHDGEKKKG